MNTSIIRSLLLIVLVTFIDNSVFAAPDDMSAIYRANVIMEVLPPGGSVIFDPHLDTQPKKNVEIDFLRKYIPKNDTSITLEHIKNTGLVTIYVTSTDTESAAKRANDLAVSIQTAVARSEADHYWHVKIWQKADASNTTANSKNNKE